jgi:hypothetical protein
MIDTLGGRMPQKLVAIAAAAIASLTLASSAHAGEVRGVDWLKVLSDLDQTARTGERPMPQLSARQAGRSTPIDDPSPQNMGNAWFGVAPRVTLVARDWTSSTLLAGDRMSLVEQMRLSASTRMVVGRARLSHTRFTPFVQVGVGQWRTDRNYLPLSPNVIEVAGQLGTGFELRLNRRWQIAAETASTTLIREGQIHTLPQKTLWSTFLASRIEF